MTDSHLRELERRFRSSDSVDDEAAWLRARVQAGELKQSNLELAASCEHPAARLALTGSAKQSREGLLKRLAKLVAGDRLVDRVRHHGHETVVRFCIAMGRRVLLNTEVIAPGDVRPSGAVEAAEAWVVCPCPSHREIAKSAAEEVQACWGEHSGQGFEPLHGLVAVKAVALAVASEEASVDVELATSSLRFYEGLSIPDGRAELLAAAAADLVPFALGLRDPVRERVEARRLAADGG